MTHATPKQELFVILVTTVNYCHKEIYYRYYKGPRYASETNFPGTIFLGGIFPGAFFPGGNFYRGIISGGQFSGRQFSRGHFSGGLFSRGHFSEHRFVVLENDPK